MGLSIDFKLVDAAHCTCLAGPASRPRWGLGNAAIKRLLWSPQGFSLVGWGDVGHLAEGALDEGSA